MRAIAAVSTETAAMALIANVGRDYIHQQSLTKLVAINAFIQVLSAKSQTTLGSQTS
jgi:hypothetical protein